MTVGLDELLAMAKELLPLSNERLPLLRESLTPAIRGTLPEPRRPADAVLSDLTQLANLGDGGAALTRYLKYARYMLGGLGTPTIDTVLYRLGRPASVHPQVYTDIDRLRVSGTTLLQGRSAQLVALDAAWSDPAIRVVSVTGPGGIGKSTLLRHWAQRRLHEARVAETPLTAFGWRFQGPGDGDTPPDTAERLMSALERWLELPVDEPVDARTRVRRISRRAGQGPILLVLDGIDAADSVGIAIDDFVSWLCSGLGKQSLCVVGSRVDLPSLSADPGHLPVRLGGLARPAAVDLLRSLGLSGRDDDFEAAAAELDDHPLALQLLGRYLKRWERGDLRRRDRLDLSIALEDPDRRISQLVSAYEAQMSDMHRALLAAIALFDRDVDETSLAVVLDDGRSANAPSELTRAQRGGLTTLQRDIGLVSRTPEDRLRLHPLVRAHLRQRMRTERPEVWRRRHRLMALHELRRACRAGPMPSHRPRRALVRAIRHGCAAGWAGGALQVYTRCLFGDDHPISDEQGALSLSLKALLPFFDQDGRPRLSMTPTEQAQVAAKFGFRLQALGRLREAIRPMTLSASTRMELGEWRGAANSAGNLSSLMLTLGRIGDAIEWGRQAVECADKGGDGRQRVSKRAIWAEALHRGGDLQTAQRVFEGAETIQRERGTGRPRLGSIMSYRFGALLAHLGRFDAVERRAREDLAWSRERGFLLAQALDHLLIGRCHRLHARLAEAEDHIDRGVDLLTLSGRLDHQPRGLIARAALRCATGRLDEADADLAAASEIAELGGMRLFRVDIGVQRCRLTTRRGQPPSDAVLARLRDEIDEVGYACAHRDLERGPAAP